jgi:mannose-1-phosphate guanylyltransferase
MTEPVQGATWSLILAAGDGTRLRSLTSSFTGQTIPKQFCSLRHGPTLLQEAIYRAAAVSPLSHTCAVVAAAHRRWWNPALLPLDPANVIVQPLNRGTGNGVLLGLLHILQRDGEAGVLILPSDHHVRQEGILSSALQEAVEQLQWRVQGIVLLGFQAENCESDLGYILPGRGDTHGTRPVLQFVEKPSPSLALELIECGALWNAMIVAARARSLLRLFQRCVPDIVLELQAAIRADGAEAQGGAATSQLYEWIPSLDFSKDVLQGQELDLRVLPVAPCGWSDLGTPERVRAALCRASAGEPEERVPSSCCWSLEEQCRPRASTEPAAVSSSAWRAKH